MSQRDDEVFPRCDKLGEPAVRKMIECNEFEILDSECAKKWLRLKESERTIRSDERAEESLSISRKALSNSRMATRIAVLAIVLSIAMAAQKIVEWLTK